jgi:O-antigen ligase
MTHAATAQEVAPRRVPDPTLEFTLKLVATAAPVALVLLLAHSKTLTGAVAVVVTLVIASTFPGVNSVRLLGVGLVLTPDAVIVAHFGSSPISLRDVALIGFYAILMLAVVRGQLRMNVPMPWLMTFLLVAAVAGAVQNHRSRSLLEFALVILLPPVAGAALATDRVVVMDFLRGVTSGTILLICAAYIEALTNHNFLISSTALGAFARTGHIRANAGWDYPTMLSAFLCLGGFFVVESLQRRGGLFGVGVGGALVTAGVITTQSRSGLAGLAAGALVYLLLQRRASQGLSVVIGLVAAGGVLLALPGAAPKAFRGYVAQSLTPGSAANANVHYRQQLYQDFWPAMQQHPLFGFGYGSGKSVATNRLHVYFGDLTDLASLPVSLGVELGYVGAGAVLLMLLVTVVKVARIRDLPWRLGIAAGLVASIVAMLGVPASPPLTWMLLVVGLGWGLAHHHQRETEAAKTTSAKEQPAEPQPLKPWHHSTDGPGVGGVRNG